MPNSLADEEMADLRVSTSLNDSWERMERAYWLTKNVLTESALLSLRDAEYKFLSGTNSVSDKYYAWLATQTGGNIVGSIADREYAARVAGALP